MRGWWQDFTDLVLPTGCGGCGTPRTALCARCSTGLTGRAPRRVRPLPEPSGLPVVHAAAPYRDSVREVLLAHKERGALNLAKPLGEALAGAVGGGVGVGGAPRNPSTTNCRPSLLLVPVPSSRGATRARGHDPTRRMALVAASVLRRAGWLAGVAPVLRQRRGVRDQVGLGPQERRANLDGALRVVTGGDALLAEDVRVVIVDDVMTTGASLTEAARALRAAGSGITLTAAVVAASPDSFEINRN
ncbi:ComF family protein [Streptomyces sp. SID4919]|uniref:ComF family protein n=1 Tax=unclassified Streptomyces TaxID=2593676 RepID=UPI000823E89A|nr:MULTISPECIES: phosphoribosyltransferase family protein [unclassified Streptomyces]MYY13759.1 ComF family protein [Streptomyces sp. SID4919]SCK63070.1 Predicted amidophosphoribosyltransferases [Streptomyces sp. AmelKG-E11A]